MLAIGGPLIAVRVIGAVQSRIDSHLQIVDANTLRVGGNLVRLFGVDAPDKRQTCRSASGAIYDCGLRAMDFARVLVRDKAVICTKGYSHGTVMCYANGRDLGAALVLAGWAVCASGTSLYRADEATARRAGRACGLARSNAQHDGAGTKRSRI
ncbi:MAG: thermonuclease family protein [Vulcanimicrobiaceae bacterium]